MYYSTLFSFVNIKFTINIKLFIFSSIIGEKTQAARKRLPVI